MRVARTILCPALEYGDLSAAGRGAACVIVQPAFCGGNCHLIPANSPPSSTYIHTCSVRGSRPAFRTFIIYRQLPQLASRDAHPRLALPILGSLFIDAIYIPHTRPLSTRVTRGQDGRMLARWMLD